jgi:hypothetical protein
MATGQIGLPFEPPFEPAAGPPGGVVAFRSDPAVHQPGAPAVPVFVRRRRAKRYLIRVMDDGGVRVTIPRGGSVAEARAFMRAEQAWIETERRRIAAARSSCLVDLTSEDVKLVRERAARELPARTREVALRLGLSVARVSVRDQRSRWGSCSPSGHICLNWRLVAMPGWIRDYVIVHELMHLECMDHSPAFWKLVAEACPEYREARRWLSGASRGLGRDWRK